MSGRDPPPRERSSRVSLRERIRGAALELGFDQVGFAPAAEPAHGDAYRRWLQRGHHGEMAYMAREDAVRRRLDPAEALPGCRTLVMTSLLYGPRPAAAVPGIGGDAEPGEPGGRDAPPSAAPAGGSGGRDPDAVVARYAVGRDYHDVFEERLDALAERIREYAPDVRCKPYVDYGPVLERDHAQRAGLGWIGKNTMLIHPRLGSYLMLGELLTTLDLPPDEPFTEDRCGTCRRCIDACPTGAILEDRTIDARRCISYLTIELRGPIPEELRPHIGGRVFGCDICQEVCPWNRDAPAPDVPPFRVEPGRPVPPGTMAAWAEELLGLTDEEFRDRYHGTAFARPGRAGLLRNLAVGLGNAGGPEAGRTLRRMIDEGPPLVAEHARWALARVEEARPIIESPTRGGYGKRSP